MKLWRISQTVNGGYDTFDAAIVAANTEDEARLVHPETLSKDPWATDRAYQGWAYDPSQVTVELIGTAKPGTKTGVVLASFNAG